MKAVDPRVTYAELEQWPDDGRRYELYGGEVIVVPTPLPVHQLLVLRISEILSEYANWTGGLTLFAPLDIVFSEYDVLQPDAVFFDAGRRQRIDMGRAIRVVPNLVVEVLSRSTAARDRGRKRDVFSRYGVPEYWIIDAKACSVEILTNGPDGLKLSVSFDENSTVVAATLADLRFNASQIFQI